MTWGIGMSSSPRWLDPLYSEAQFRKRDHLRAWANHAALNLGSALECFWHVVLPPQVDHRAKTVISLAGSNPILEFGYGLGVLTRPKPPSESGF